MKLPEVPFLILINHRDESNIIKYQKLLYSLGAHSCIGGTKTFTYMVEENEGIYVSNGKTVSFSNTIKIKREGGKVYTMKKFDMLQKIQLEFDF